MDLDQEFYDITENYIISQDGIFEGRGVFKSPLDDDLSFLVITIFGNNNETNVNSSLHTIFEKARITGKKYLKFVFVKLFDNLEKL